MEIVCLRLSVRSRQVPLLWSEEVLGAVAFAMEGSRRISIAGVMVNYAGVRRGRLWIVRVVP